VPAVHVERLAMKCESCDIEIAALPLWRGDRYFCCSGCADGGPCICSYVDDPARLGKSAGDKPVRVKDLLDRYDQAIDESSRANRKYLG
jgi:hypothetical protein